jgi:hypothetical protein
LEEDVMAIKIILQTEWSGALVDLLKEKMGITPLFTQPIEGEQTQVYYGNVSDPKTIAEMESHALQLALAKCSVKEY